MLSWGEPPPGWGWYWGSRRRSGARWRWPSGPGYQRPRWCWIFLNLVRSQVFWYIQVQILHPEILANITINKTSRCNLIWWDELLERIESRQSWLLERCNFDCWISSFFFWSFVFRSAWLQCRGCCCCCCCYCCCRSLRYFLTTGYFLSHAETRWTQKSKKITCFTSVKVWLASGFCTSVS